MRLLLTTTLLAVLFAPLAQAQTPQVQFGIEAGMGVKTMWGNQIVDAFNDFGVGYGGNLAVEYAVSDAFSLRSGFGYENKGVYSTIHLTDEFGNTIDSEASQDEILNYLTLPVTGRIAFGNQTKMFLNAGGYISFLSSQKGIVEVPSTNTYLETGGSGQYKSFDFGLVTGMGVSHLIKERWVLSLEARNLLGLYNISALPVIGDRALRNSHSLLLFGVAYGIGELL